MNETLKKIISSGKVVGGIGVFAARAYVNYKYPMAKPAWKRASIRKYLMWSPSWTGSLRFEIP